MQILSTSSEIEKNICDFIKKYKNISLSVAWASASSKAFGVLMQDENKRKIQSSTVGLHFYQTHPDFIKEFLDDEKVRFHKQSEGVFHPKIYLFWNDENDWICLIGSANFTLSALTKNSEVMTMFDINDKVEFQSIKNIIDSYHSKSTLMTQKMLDDYIEKRKKSKKGTSDDFKLEKSIKDMEWSEYYSLLLEKGNYLDERLNLLAKAKEYFEQNTFEDMTEEQRKNIAGVRKSGLHDNVDNWFLFGHMPSSLFANRVSENDTKCLDNKKIKSFVRISRALENIDFKNESNKQNFEKYIKYFEDNKGCGYGLSTVTRLIAIKRPDEFFCITAVDTKKKGNAKELYKNFNIEKPIKNYTEYWNKIIEPVRQSPWYKSDKPTDTKELQVWNNRVALMDALFYDENKD